MAESFTVAALTLGGYKSECVQSIVVPVSLTYLQKSQVKVPQHFDIVSLIFVSWFLLPKHFLTPIEVYTKQTNNQ